MVFKHPPPFSRLRELHTSLVRQEQVLGLQVAEDDPRKAAARGGGRGGGSLERAEVETPPKRFQEKKVLILSPPQKHLKNIPVQTFLGKTKIKIN